MDEGGGGWFMPILLHQLFHRCPFWRYAHAESFVIGQVMMIVQMSKK